MRCLIFLAVWCGLLLPSAAREFADLSKDLTSGDLETRREAAFQLRALGADALPALPALIEALEDEDEQVAGRAMTTIARIGPRATDAIPALIRCLNPRQRRYDDQVIFRSAFALSEVGTASIDPLRIALKDDSDDRRFGAAQALQLIGQASEPAIPELVEALHDSDQKVRHMAAEALAAIGSPAIQPVLTDLENRPSAAAVEAIGLIGPGANAAGDQLVALLENPDEALHAATIRSLGAIGLPFTTILPQLQAALTASSEPVRLAAANVLLSYPDPETNSLPTLERWLGDEDQVLRERAAWVAGQFGSDGTRLALPLIAMLDRGDDTALVTTALSGLGAGATGVILEKISNTPIDELRSGQEPHWVHAVLASAGRLALPQLEVALDSAGASARYAALEALGKLGKIARPLEPKFRQATSDPEPAVRLAALDALDATGSDPKRLANILQRRSADESAEVRAVAVRLIGKISSEIPSAYQLVDSALGDPEYTVQRAAVFALSSFGTEAGASVPKLIELAARAGGDTGKRLAILQAITAIGTRATEALPLVRGALEDPDPQIRGAAISALVALEPEGEQLTEVLAKMLDDENKAVRHPAIEGLGKRGESASAAAPKLFELLDSEGDRDEALEALSKIRSHDVDLYVSALDNPEPRVRLFACEALGRLGKEAERAIPQLEKTKRDRYDFVRKRAEDAIRRIRG